MMVSLANRDTLELLYPAKTGPVMLSLSKYDPNSPVL